MDVNGREENDAEHYLGVARDAYRHGDFDAANESLTRGILALSEDRSRANERRLRVALFFALGNVHLRQGAFTDALLAYGVASAAAKAAGDRIRALQIGLWIGEAYRRAGKDMDAEVRWRDLVRAASDTGAAAEHIRKDAFRRLGSLLESRGRTFEAARIRRLVGAHPEGIEPPFD